MSNASKIIASLKKDFLLLIRDYTSLMLLFFLPIIMVVLITSIQIAAFDLINKDQINLLLVNNDKGEESVVLKNKIESFGRFRVIEVKNKELSNELLYQYNSYVAIEIPNYYSDSIQKINGHQTKVMMQLFGLSDSISSVNNHSVSYIPLVIMFDPIMKADFKSTIIQALNSVVQIQDSEQLIRNLYKEINEIELDSSRTINMQTSIKYVEKMDSILSNKQFPNATQHNIPAWTLFAMFFMVVSLGSTIVKEKTNGSFLRLQMMPTPFYFSLISKLFIYLMLASFQVFVLLLIGYYLFPIMNLPQLNLNVDVLKLIVVVSITSLSAIFYSIAIGMFARTVDQSNGFGSISIVILSALGGVMVPSFIMPESLIGIMKISPIYWSLNAFYDVFLVSTSWTQLMSNIYPLIGFIVIVFLLIVFKLKKEHYF